jgi:hypothetical protein
MAVIKNSELLTRMLKALYDTTSRRTYPNFAIAVLGAITKTLEKKYEFLKYVNFHGGTVSEDVILIDPEINYTDPIQVGKAIEVIIQVVYMDLHEKAGLYFIKELKDNAGSDVISRLMDVGVDLDLIQIQQHYLYRRKNRDENEGLEKLDNVSLLGYSWKNVSNWELDPYKKVCIIYGRDGNLLDVLDLDTIVKNYVKNLGSGELAEISKERPEVVNKIYLSEKDLELLKIILKSDLDAETAARYLHVTVDELESMINKLLKYEILQYVSSNEVTLTEIGFQYLQKKDKMKKTALS